MISIKYKCLCMVLILMLSVSPLFAAEEIDPPTMEKYRQVKTALDQMIKGKAGIYARDVVESAQRTLAKAQEGIDAKKEKATRAAVEMANLQLELAKARAEDREAAEKTAVTRAKVDKLEQRLGNILAGKGGEK